VDQRKGVQEKQPGDQLTQAGLPGPYACKERESKTEQKKTLATVVNRFSFARIVLWKAKIFLLVHDSSHTPGWLASGL